jgi:hypothetical protein
MNFALQVRLLVVSVFNQRKFTMSKNYHAQRTVCGRVEGPVVRQPDGQGAEKIMPKAHNAKLVTHLETAQTASHCSISSAQTPDRPARHRDQKEHCKGMEGLCSKPSNCHGGRRPKAGPDAAIIAQYQRMTHYGITGLAPCQLLPGPET